MTAPAGTSCSTCGASLSATAECLACLVRLGFDDSGEELLPDIFGDYEIARRDDGSLWELGRGAMGATYLARDKVLERTVALKVVHPPAAETEHGAVRQRFLREARAAAAFRHPNVAGVFQFGASPDGDRCYYAMELVEGETLEALVRRDGPLTVERALEIAAQVTQALIAAAKHGLVHRDLKPGNIMIARHDGAAGEPLVKVIDFGLAKAATESAGAADLTHSAFVGTPAFASPEQFSGAAADARSDIYSLGVTLWYMLTGEVPYGGRTIEQIRQGHRELALPLEKLKARRLPKPVVRLLCQVLAEDPTERPNSARKLMDALEGCRRQLGYGGGQTSRRWSRPRNAALIAGAALLVLGVFVAVRWRERTGTPPVPAPPKSIAVLPFEDRSADKANTAFADGVQDEILTMLSQVADLKVIGRTSVMHFRNAEKRKLGDIARELGVAHLLEGSVQRAEGRVRVTAQLIEARSGAQLWADHYDGELADVFAIQSEIAQKIASQLRAVLSPNEQAALGSQPTRDTAAYELYLRARDRQREGGAGGVMGRNALTIITLLEEAVARDPAFVPALCLLAQAHLQAYWYNEDHTPARLELARKAIESAERLQPDNGEVHLTRALFYYQGHRAYAPALVELALAASRLPNDATILFYIATIQRRQGRWNESIQTMERALLLDPRNAYYSLNLCWTYRALRRYAEAKRVIDSLLAWKSGDLQFQLVRAEIELEEKADPTAIREVLSRAAPGALDDKVALTYRITVAYLQRDFGATERAYAEHPPWESTHGFSTPREYWEGICAQRLGELDRARAAFLRARERAAEPVSARPDDAKALIILARIDANLGQKDQAIDEAERAAALLPIETDAWDGGLMLVRLVHVYAAAGEIDRAIEVLERAATLPAGPAYGMLALDAQFDALRSDPRFQKITASLAPARPR